MIRLVGAHLLVEVHDEWQPQTAATFLRLRWRSSIGLLRQPRVTLLLPPLAGTRPGSRVSASTTPAAVCLLRGQAKGEPRCFNWRTTPRAAMRDQATRQRALTLVTSALHSPATRARTDAATAVVQRRPRRSRTVPSAKPSRFRPRHSLGRPAPSLCSASPIPQTVSFGLASTKTCGAVDTR